MLNDMKKLAFACLLSLAGGAQAQTETSPYQPGVTAEGAVYFLPKTVLRFVVQVEKTTFTPGDFCKYASRYLRLGDVRTRPGVGYRVTSISMDTYGEADKAKGYAVEFNPKSVAANIALADDGTLLAINAAPRRTEAPKPFRPAPRRPQPNPRSYLSEEVLAAGSTAKMAELAAHEIYEIRDSKDYLNRGEADYMPKDGEQLRIMLANLDRQDRALTQLFTGSEVKDTMEYVLTICPQRGMGRQVLFRLSGKLGLVDADDLSGVPYYITVTDEQNLPEVSPEAPKGKKKDKQEGVYVNVPGKITATIYRESEVIDSFEAPAAQYGYTELLSGELFNKRYTTHLTLNPATGAIDRLEAEQPK